jgi:hypothetical protein
MPPRELVSEQSTKIPTLMTISLVTMLPPPIPPPDPAEKTDPADRGP